MQVFLRKLVENPYVLPILIVCICIWRIFTPQLPANQGLGWDGARYYSLAVDGFQSKVLDSYLVLRIFPSLFIHVIFKLFSIAFTPASVILAFKIMNTVLIGLSAFMVKWIFNHYKLDAVSQFTGFVLVFLNYEVLNFTYYYPVMTDTPAFFLSVALFYFFLRGQQTNIFLLGLIGAFTWSVLFLMSIALILFPLTENHTVPLKKPWRIIMCTLCLLYGVGLSWYAYGINGDRAEMLFTLPISEGMLPVSIICTGLIFFFMPLVLNNKSFTGIEYYRQLWNGKRIFAVIALFILFIIIRMSITVVQSSQYLTIYHQLTIPLVYNLARPGIEITSIFNFSGCAILLMILFWKKFTGFISTFGLGVAGYIFVNLLAFGVNPESRCLAHFYLWIVILLSLYLGKFQFSKMFYILIFILNFALAKLWLFFDYDLNSKKLLSDGTFDFPNQWFMMHLGKWMSEYVWLWLCMAVAVSLLLFVVSLYKIEFNKKAILFYKKYEPVTYG